MWTWAEGVAVSETASEVAGAMDPIDIEEADAEAQSAPVGRETHAESSGGDDGLPLDQVFEILRNQRRRHVIRLLKEVDGQVTMGELSERIAAIENDKSVSEISSSERKRVYVGLYQCHLPKMDGMDVVDFNKPRGIIEPGSNVQLVEQYLESRPVGHRPWYRYYGALAAFGGMVLLGLAAVGDVLGGVLAVGAVLGMSVGFLGLSALHAWTERKRDDARDGPTRSAGGG